MLVYQRVLFRGSSHLVWNYPTEKPIKSRYIPSNPSKSYIKIPLNPIECLLKPPLNSNNSHEFPMKSPFTVVKPHKITMKSLAKSPCP